MRRVLFFVSCLAAALLASYSCSMRASLTTDGSGHVVEVSNVRVESSLAGLAVAMLVIGGEVALEFRWNRDVGGASSARLGG